MKIAQNCFIVAFDQYITYHPSRISKANIHRRAEDILSPEASLMFALARHRGQGVHIEADWQDFVLPPLTDKQ